MKFEDALEQNPAPTRIGDVRLRFDGSMLIGEADHTFSLRDLMPEALFIGGFGAGVACAAVLLFGGNDQLTLAIVLAVVAAVLTVGASTAERRVRGRRRFILNFGTESLRIDVPSKIRGLPRTTVVPFDDVANCSVVPRPDGGYGLTVTIVGRPEDELIVDRVRPDDIDELRRFWRLLRGAFGLSAAPTVAEED